MDLDEEQRIIHKQKESEIERQLGLHTTNQTHKIHSKNTP